jgi:hypothetical protein
VVKCRWSFAQGAVNHALRSGEWGGRMGFIFVSLFTKIRVLGGAIIDSSAERESRETAQAPVEAQQSGAKRTAKYETNNMLASWPRGQSLNVARHTPERARPLQCLRV